MSVLSHLHVVCYKWGSKYVAEDVNILRAMVARNLGVTHTFHCITDDPVGIAEGVVVHPLPAFEFEGIWRKLYTFSEGFLGLDGQHVVGLDLDVVIVGSLDFLASHPEKDFRIGRNWGADGRASGTAYRLKVGTQAFLYDRFVADLQAAIERYHSKDRFTGEQTWLDHHVDDFDFLPGGKIVSFKEHGHAKATLRTISRRFGVRWSSARFGTARPPEGAAIVSFHGHPLPRDMLDGPVGHWMRAPFVAHHWHL